MGKLGRGIDWEIKLGPVRGKLRKMKEVMGSKMKCNVGEVKRSGNDETP